MIHGVSSTSDQHPKSDSHEPSFLVNDYLSTMSHFKVIDCSTYDYLIIGCGYVNRPKLVKKIDRLIKDEKAGSDGEHSFMFRWGEGGMVMYQDDKDGLVDAVRKLSEKHGFMRDSICINGGGDTSYILDELRSVGHCACWGEAPCTVATFRTKTDKLVLYQGYDTESG